MRLGGPLEALQPPNVASDQFGGWRAAVTEPRSGSFAVASTGCQPGPNRALRAIRAHNQIGHLGPLKAHKCPKGPKGLYRAP